MTIFEIILRNIRSKYTPTRTKVHHFLKIFSEDLLNPVRYAHLLLFAKKITIQKGPLFPKFKRFSSIHKNK